MITGGRATIFYWASRASVNHTSNPAQLKKAFSYVSKHFFILVEFPSLYSSHKLVNCVTSDRGVFITYCTRVRLQKYTALIRFPTFSAFFSVKLTVFTPFITVSGNRVITVIQRLTQRHKHYLACCQIRQNPRPRRFLVWSKVSPQWTRLALQRPPLPLRIACRSPLPRPTRTPLRTKRALKRATMVPLLAGRLVDITLIMKKCCA
jgi:hypothetical protein